MVSLEQIEKAIDQIEHMIGVMISDIALGASYTRVNATACLDLINLKKELLIRKTALEPKVVKSKAKK
jgi:cell division ATPase FtsA